MSIVEVVILLTGSLAAVLLLRQRCAGGVDPGAWISEHARRPGLAVRCTDTVILLLTAGLIVGLLSLNPRTMGYLGRLDGLNLSTRRYVVTWAVLAAAGVLAAGFAAFLGRTRLGVLIGAGTAIVYFAAFNGPGSPLALRTTSRQDIGIIVPQTRLTLGLGASLDGVDITVNGVPLGKTPVVMDLDEFRRRVPVWPGPPQAYDDPSEKVDTPQRGLNPSPTRSYRTWMEFKLPRMIDHYDNHRAVWGDELPAYYAQASFDGHPVLASGGYSGGGGGGTFHQRYQVTIGAVCPAREAALADLLRRIRLADYDVAGPLLGDIRSAGTAMWHTLRTGAPREAALDRVLDAWARAAYDIPTESDADTAYAVLERLMTRADERRMFDTAGPEGRAVELLAAGLARAPERLGDSVIPFIKSRASYGVSWQMQNGRVDFSCDQTDTAADESVLPPRAYVLAHAICCVVRCPSAADGNSPLQSDVATALLAYHYSTDLAMRAAAALGGPVVTDFLLRQDWRASIHFGEGDWWKNSTTVAGAHVNRWMFALCSLRGDAGRTFRSEHADAVVAFVEGVGTHGFSDAVREQLFSVAFMDGGGAWQGSLGERLWPTYRTACLAGSHHDLLGKLWWYLARCGADVPRRLYVQAWQDAALQAVAQRSGSPFVDAAGRQLDPLAVEERIAVLKVVKESLDRSLGGDSTGNGGQQARNDLQKLDFLLLELGDAEAVDALVAQLSEPGAELRRECVAQWLAYENPFHPLLDALLTHTTPQVRALGLPALEQCPTRPHRDWLKALVDDPAPEIRREVRRILQGLEIDI